jgi:hypothetical protein
MAGKIGAGLIAFSHVLLNDHTKETLDKFEQDVAKFPEVMECFQMTGTVDFILRIATTDMEAYRDFYRNKLATLPNISTVQSYFVLSEVKSETAYPLQVRPETGAKWYLDFHIPDGYIAKRARFSILVSAAKPDKNTISCVRGFDMIDVNVFQVSSVYRLQGNS